jgi:hypothetical protein
MTPAERVKLHADVDEWDARARSLLAPSTPVDVVHPEVIAPRRVITAANEPGWHKRARWTALFLVVVAALVGALLGVAALSGRLG